MFDNRTDAGRKLGKALERYRGTRAQVLGIPPGGAEVACEVAMALDLELSVVGVRRLALPDNPATEIGAVAEDGSQYIFPGASQRLARPLLQEIARKQQKEVAGRMAVLRGGAPLPSLLQCHVILVDDDIVRDSTMRAAIKCCRRLGAHRVTVATPVAGPDARTALAADADEAIALLCPPFLWRGAEFYRDSRNIRDEDLYGIIGKARASGVWAARDMVSEAP